MEERVPCIEEGDLSEIEVDHVRCGSGGGRARRRVGGRLLERLHGADE